MGAGQQEQNRSAVRMMLFVADGERNSLRAKENLIRFCEEHLGNDYQLEVIDVLEDFQAAVERNVMVTPTLIVTHPPPIVTVLGDLRDTERLRAALG